MPSFRPFGLDHWLVLAVTGATASALIVEAARLRGLRHDQAIRVGLAGLLIGNEALGWTAYLMQGVWGLPLHLCDLSVMLVAWALLRQNRLVEEVGFCWALSGSVQALLTPDLSDGFPSLHYLTFFLQHYGAVVGALYLAVRGRVRMTAESVWRVWMISNGYVVAAGLVNWLWGTNLGYLARKPDHASLLDYLGPWPYYVIGIEVIALISFMFCWQLSVGIERVIERTRLRGAEHA